MENPTLKKLEEIAKDISLYEKKGFDASSLKLFIKNFKKYLQITNQLQLPFSDDQVGLEAKLKVIKEFLEDKNVFPTISDVIEFANTKLSLDFRDQKASRNITIARIIARIESKPELKEVLKDAVISIRNEKVHTPSKSRKEIISAETFIKWADIIKNI